MVINVDTDLLFENHLEIDEFLIAYLIVKKRQDLIEKYLDTFNLSNTKYLYYILKKLEVLGMIEDKNKEGEYDLSKITVKPLLRKLVNSKNKFYENFEELLLVYPTSVVRRDGTIDFLKVDLPKCEKLYEDILKSGKFEHEHIIQALKWEIAFKESSGKMQYMKRLPKWLASEEWRSYEGILKSMPPTVAKEDGELYGTKLE
jgi:hypothetical protein